MRPSLSFDSLDLLKFAVAISFSFALLRCEIIKQTWHIVGLQWILTLLTYSGRMRYSDTLDRSIDR